MSKIRGFFIRLSGMKKKEKKYRIKRYKKDIDSGRKNRGYGV